jgi:hypothetical protein
VCQQGYLQDSYIEEDAGLPFLADWWEAWSSDFFNLRQEEAQAWARAAIDEASRLIYRRDRTDKTLRHMRR